MTLTPEAQEKMLLMLQGMRRDEVGLSGKVLVAPIFRYLGWFKARRKEYRKFSRKVEFGFAEAASISNTNEVRWTVPRKVDAYLGFTLRDERWGGLLYESRDEIPVRPEDVLALPVGRISVTL